MSKMNDKDEYFYSVEFLECFNNKMMAEKTLTKSLTPRQLKLYKYIVKMNDILETELAFQSFQVIKKRNKALASIVDDE